MVICIAAFAMSAVAQDTGSGTSGTVPVFTESSSPTSAVTISSISVSGKNVGIGTTNPPQLLSVHGGDISTQRSAGSIHGPVLYLDAGNPDRRNVFGSLQRWSIRFSAGGIARFLPKRTEDDYYEPSQCFRLPRQTATTLGCPQAHRQGKERRCALWHRAILSNNPECERTRLPRRDRLS